MDNRTAEQILEAAERLLVTSPTASAVSVRRIATAAGVNVAAISYHFGSRERLLGAVFSRVYQRFNTERLNRLQAAVDASAPEPPPLSAVLAALVGPSIDWSFEAGSDYPAFVHFASLQTTDPDLRRTLAGSVDHLQPFLAVLRGLAPWLSDGDIGWRIHCVLGIRHNAIRYRERATVLVAGAFDLTDPRALLDRIIDVAEPMFRPPPGRPPGR